METAAADTCQNAFLLLLLLLYYINFRVILSYFLLLTQTRATDKR